MNETIAQLHERRSARAYTDEPVSAADERAILEAACQAPTAGNQQLYSIVVVRDQAEKDELAVTCDNQPFIATAPLVLVFCVDVRRWHQAFLAADAVPREPGVGDFLLALEDTAIAAQNAVVAAHSLGLGSCYIGDILERREEQARILGCPRYVVPAVMLVIGHPTEGQLRRVKPVRLPLEDIVFENRYETRDADRLLEDLRPKAPASRDLADWACAFCERKWNSDFSREMTRSAAAILADFATEAS
ncbi:nitroreductase family protein [Olsenella sp. DSM 107455]|uniref:Nitroreductase family protein n=1 Tax=Thermophilibacter gallinarum TaxID=2779357 RepID=A0ABR9QSL3_9ACTN|nr:nitroreductase family protein [Thermophilibacter gallinarum]MBE5024039.1 nitroreductase family protein [Thermophilibacter gallinarum]